MMNDKIKEFAEKSGIASFLTNGSVVSPWVEDTDIRDYVKEFADLIVKECIASCLEVKDEYLRQGRDAQEEAFLVAAVDDCISNINQHFGV